ncbi:MAG: tRNA preQ1(34) S-adenosylmethionine ribosyltransferase-isomerase QueA [bacterium]
MLTSDFDYDLPPELIAQEPPATRTAARMLVLARATGAWEHRGIADLPAFLHAGDLLVLNDTRVFPARLLGAWADTGGAVELLLLERSDPTDPSDRPVHSPSPAETWHCICGSGRRARAGQRATLAAGQVAGEIVEAQGGGRVLARLRCAGPLADVLEAHGRVPVPPYIHRAAGDARGALDRERYQTVYAREPGAVAAPTAGLHFTPELLAALAAQGVPHAFVTLHVGPGTFQPVQVENLDEHRMESERYAVPEATAAALAACRARRGRVVAVGSTTVRTLETVAAAHDGRVVAGSGRTGIFIRPPYAFRAADALLTNFHLPRSTLLAMVSAFAGRERVLAAYREAVAQRYRFFSYGDCMLILGDCRI